MQTIHSIILIRNGLYVFSTFPPSLLLLLVMILLSLDLVTPVELPIEPPYPGKPVPPLLKDLLHFRLTIGRYLPYEIPVESVRNPKHRGALRNFRP